MMKCERHTPHSTESCYFCEGQSIVEKLTFDQLFSISEPKRVLRSKTVRGPPLDVEAKKDGVYYHFNFKAFPSTTGRRHKGYIKFFKPKKQMPLEKVDCLVDCDCEDYRYRWAWTNKQRGSGKVGPNSLNQAWNKAPKITNPRGKSGLCKHLLSLRDFIYGELENFDGEGDTSERLDKVVQAVQSRPSPTVKQTAGPAKLTKVEPKKNLDKKPTDVKDTGPTKPTPKRPAVIKPVKSQSATQKTELPDEFSDQVQRRFSKVESVLRDVNISQTIKEADDVSVDPEASEALTLLREIRDNLKIIAARDDEDDEQDEAPPPDKAPAEGPAPDDLPEPGDEFAPEGTP